MPRTQYRLSGAYFLLFVDVYLACDNFFVEAKVKMFFVIKQIF